MCGIVGAIAKRNVVPILIEGLKRLEYRGYDSAGIAVLDGKAAGGSRARLRRVRSTGRVAELEKLAGAQGFSGGVGIAHTRWATHGVPSEKNAHPHVSGGVSSFARNCAQRATRSFRTPTPRSSRISSTPI